MFIEFSLNEILGTWMVKVMDIVTKLRPLPCGTQTKLYKVLFKTNKLQELGKAERLRLVG